MASSTFRARCPFCRHPYVGRAFTERERENPGLHLLTFRPLLCRCGRTFVASEVREWVPEGL